MPSTLTALRADLEAAGWTAESPRNLDVESERTILEDRWADR